MLWDGYKSHIWFMSPLSPAVHIRVLFISARIFLWMAKMHYDRLALFLHRWNDIRHEASLFINNFTLTLNLYQLTKLTIVGHLRCKIWRFPLHGMFNSFSFDSSEPMHISIVKKEIPGFYEWDLRHHFIYYVHAESYMIMHQDNNTVIYLQHDIV